MILLVEDDEAIRETMSEILTAQGYQIREAVNGKEALDTIHALDDAHQPCVILLDLKMPVMDGKKFLEEMQRDYHLTGKRRVPIIITSASFEATKLDLPLVTKMLMKPYNLDEVLKTIEEYCG